MRNNSSEGLIANDPSYLTFHLWLLIAVACGFAVFITLQTGGLSFVIENDSTFISSAIMLFFLSSTFIAAVALFDFPVSSLPFSSMPNNIRLLVKIST